MNRKRGRDDEVPDGETTAGCINTQACSTQLNMVFDDPSITEAPCNIPSELLVACEDGDILLVCQDNNAVRCHSQILSITSKVLHAMLFSTGACDGSSKDRPVRVPVPEDKAEHWVQALLYLYPLTFTPLCTTANHAMALALLSDKYDIPRLASIAEQFISKLSSADPNIGHIKLLVSEKFLYAAWPGHASPVFSVAGHLWSFRVNQNDQLDGSTSSSASVYLIRKRPYAEGQAPNVSFAVALVSQAQPTQLSHVLEQETPKTLECALGWSDFITYEKLSKQDAEYVNEHGQVEFQCIVRVHENADGNGTLMKTQLSCDPQDPCYVFSWLELAHKTNHERLHKTCIDFVGRNVFYALFNKKFNGDLHEALKSMGADSAIRLMRSGQGYL